MLFLHADSTSTSLNSEDLSCHDVTDRRRLQQPLTPYNRQDYLVPASAPAAGDVTTYWNNSSQTMPFFEHLLPALLRRVTGSVDAGAGSLVDGGDVFACTDCTKRYISASNLARHRVTHQRSATTAVASATTDRRVSRQCPHCAKVEQSLQQLLGFCPCQLTLRQDPASVAHGCLLTLCNWGFAERKREREDSCHIMRMPSA